MIIVTLNPPFPDKVSHEARTSVAAESGTFHYPMWLAYATGYLEKRGHHVQLIDAAARKIPVETIAGMIADCKPDMVIIDTRGPGIYNDSDVAEKIKKLIPSVLIVLVGPHVSEYPKEILQSSGAADAIAVKEYDITLAEVADRLSTIQNRNELFSQVNGIVFRAPDNSIVVNPDQEYISDLDILPFVSTVYRKHLSIGDYFYSHHRHQKVSLVTGRGGRQKCTDSDLPQTFHGHMNRNRSVANVVCEFLYIQDQLPDVKEIRFEDDTVTVNKERCRELAYSLLEARATTIPWSANAGTEPDLDTLKLLRKAGCRRLYTGFQRGEQDILNNVNKETILNEIRKFTRNAKRAGILVN